MVLATSIYSLLSTLMDRRRIVFMTLLHPDSTAGSRRVWRHRRHHVRPPLVSHLPMVILYCSIVDTFVGGHSSCIAVNIFRRGSGHSGELLFFCPQLILYQIFFGRDLLETLALKQMRSEGPRRRHSPSLPTARHLLPGQ